MEENNFYLLKNGLGGFDINLRGAYIGYQNAETAEKVTENAAAFDSLQFVVKGHGSLQIEGKSTYMLKSGTVFYIPKGVKVGYWPVVDDPYEFYTLSVDSFDNPKFFEQVGFTKAYPVMYFDENVLNQVESLYEIAKNTKFADGLKCISLLYRIFGLLAEQSEAKPSANIENAYVAQAINYINAKYYDDINVNTIVDMLKINRSYFSVLFKKTTGKTVLNYLTEFRIEQACKLLTMDKNVTEVAILTGFNTPTNFGLHFKRIMKMTPLEYKKHLKIKEKVNEKIR